MNAAVTDYRFKETFKGKLKKKEKNLKVELVPTPDILAELGKRKENQLLVGFAVETDNLIENALQKLKRKNLDAIVVNPAEVMGSDRYRGILLAKTGQREEIEASAKEEGAFLITQRVAQIFLGED